MNKQYIYVNSCVENGGIYTYVLTENGKLELKDFTPCDRPMHMIISGEKCMFYFVLPSKTQTAAVL